MKRRMWSLAFGLVCAGMTLSVQGHAGWTLQKAQAVSSMSSLDLPAFRKPITKRFVNARLSEVLAWLSLEKFSFVADVSEFPEQGQVTLNFQSQPLGAVLDAIADAYHGRWERRGDIFTLRSGATRAALGATAMPLTERSTRFGGLGGSRVSTVLTPSTGVATTATAPALIPAQGAVALPQGVAPRALTVPAEGVATGPATTIRSRNLAPTIVQGLSAPRAFARSLSPVVVESGARNLYGAVSVPKIDTAITVAPRAVAEAKELPLTIYGAQDAKSQEEAMKQAERALKEAEEAIRKMHESGEWQRAMEKAMSEAQGEHSEAMRKAMEEVRRAMQDMPKSKEWKEAWAKAREELRQALKSGKVTENGKTRNMTPKERAAMEKTLKNWDTKGAPDFKWDFKEMPKFDEKAFVMPKMDFEKLEKMHELQGKSWVMPDIDKKIFEKMQHMPNMKVWAGSDMDKKAFEKMMKDHKTFVFPKMEGKEWKFFTPEGFGDADRETKIRQKIEEMHRKAGVKGGDTFTFTSPSMKGFENMKGLEGMKPFVLNSKKTHIKDFLDSLTSEQKEKQEKNGYLTVDDLSPKQREMLGDLPKVGNWTVSYSIDGKHVTIKGK